MEHTIKVPDIGEGIAEVELVAWHVQPGEVVKEDQPLADVMTDKAAVEIPSPVSGRVLSLGGEVGQVLAVGSALVRIELSAEGKALPLADTPSPSPAVLSASPFATASLATSQHVAASSPAVARPSSSATAAPTPPDQPKPPSEARPIASPAVRRRAWELGIDLREVLPSGPGGRIMQADLEAFGAQAGRPQAAAEAPPPRLGSSAPQAKPATPATVAEPGQEVIAVIGLRRRIAQRMQEAKRRIPHFTYVEEVDVTELEALRARLNRQEDAAGGHLTLLPFIVRAMALTLPGHPGLNAHFNDEAGRIVRHAAVHVGIATQTPNGLMVPVLRHAEKLGIHETAAEIARLADAARSGRITHGELTGSTISLTSLGALGGIVSTPIINLPEVAIVGINRIVERPVIRDGAVVPRLLMNLSSSFDHRVVDGHDAARFIQDLRARLQAPEAWATEA